MKGGKGNRKRNLRRVFLLIGFLIGAGIAFYPLFSKLWNRWRDSLLIAKYQGEVEEIPEADYRDVLEAARAYNDQHRVNRIVDIFGQSDEEYVLTHPYDTLLNPFGDLLMGHLEIPAIRVDLPIYHGCGSASLEKGVGHLEGTSLPIGGPGTHTVLSGHRGLPGRQLLTDLDRVQIGDRFYIHVLNEVLAYEIDQILTVLPDETEALSIEEGEDLATLVTCTPYSVNTHRLLVRGRRVPYDPEEKKEKSISETIGDPGTEERILLTGLMVLAVLILFFWILSRRGNDKGRF